MKKYVVRVYQNNGSLGIEVNELKIGDYSIMYAAYPNVHFSGTISPRGSMTEGQETYFMHRWLKTLGIVSYLEKRERELLLDGDFGEKRARIFTESFREGMEMLPSAIETCMGSRRTSRSIAKRVARETGLYDGELAAYREPILKRIGKEIKSIRRAKKVDKKLQTA